VPGPALAERRPGRFLPEQRSFFWVAAGMLLDQTVCDAVALWVEEEDELRPLLLFSALRLSSGIKQQVQRHFMHHLPGVDQRFFQPVTKARSEDGPVMEGNFPAYARVLLWEEEGRKDLMLLFRTRDQPFSPQEIERAAQAGRLIEMHLQEGRLHERYHRSFLSFCQRILKTGEARHPLLRGHSLATAKLARNVALRLELPTVEVEALAIAAVLHDVGTLLLDPAMLAKHDLSSEELAKVRTHPVLASTFLKEFRFPFDVLRIIRHHHERWDGRGYPDGLAGDQIPLGSRIIGVIEAYEVMTSPQSYRSPVTPNEALNELLRESGTQFDPMVVATFQGIMQAGR
jgi:putative nucleotidyltransferase with HDIG domain